MEEKQKKSKTTKDLFLRKYRIGGHIGSDERLMEAMRKNRAIMAYAAEALGVTRQAVFDYIKRRPHLHAEIDEINETILDVSEDKLFNAIAAGDSRCIMFHLRTKGKNRGYVERTEMVGENGGPIQVQATPMVQGPSDNMITGIDVDSLTREERIELSELCEMVDKGGTSLVLTPTQFARAQELIIKSRPQKPEELKALPSPESE